MRSEKKKKISALRLRILIGVTSFILILVAVGFMMQFRMRELLQNYMEKQVTAQAKSLSYQTETRLDMELTYLEQMADYLTRSEEASENIVSDTGNYLMLSQKTEGVSLGLLELSGDALYGESLAVRDFAGIRDSFRGNSTVSYCPERGLLFSVPVYRGKNVKYVLYRLYDNAILTDEFCPRGFDGQGDIAIVDLNENLIVPFRHKNYHQLLQDIESLRAYESILEQLNVSTAASVLYGEAAADKEFMFVAEVASYGVYLVGTVPDDAVSAGIYSLIGLVIWVFALLILLMGIGIVYLFSIEERAQESEELRLAKLAAEDANRSKSAFLANMSHEIRTPINAIVGMNEMILRESNDGEVRKYATNIASASQTLLSLINDILDLSKIESGKMEIVEDTYRLGDLLRDVTNMIAVKAEQKGLRFRVEIDESLPDLLFGDEVRNRQIMLNILNNAVKYTDSGSVLFQVEEAGREEDRVALRIMVKDTGIGIRSEDLHKLFGNFERLDLRKNRNVEGTGLGLAITHKLVEAMGGQIDVSSVYGEGSTFTVLLPQRIMGTETIGEYEKEHENDGERIEEIRAEYTAPNAKVLVVDDYPMNLAVVKGLLKRTAVQVVTCESGAECLELMSKDRYDLIFLDHMMPEMDGIEVMRRAAQLPDNQCSDTPVIALTANAIVGVRDLYLKEGFTDYLSKPIESGKLEEMLWKYIPKELRVVSQGDPQDTKKQTEESIKGTDSDYIDLPLALEYCMEDEAFLKEMLTIFLDTEERKYAEIQEAYESADWENYHIQVHALKSASLNVGAKRLSDQARLLEQAIKEHRMEYVTEHHEEMMKLYLATVEAARQITG